MSEFYCDYLLKHEVLISFFLFVATTKIIEKHLLLFILEVNNSNTFNSNAIKFSFSYFRFVFYLEIFSHLANEKNVFFICKLKIG